jgi:hypothetical protein
LNADFCKILKTCNNLIMYDYKFRHAAAPAGRPKTQLRKLLIRVTAVLVAVAAFYGAFLLDDVRAPSGPQSNTDSDIIPLALPPRFEPPQD